NLHPADGALNLPEERHSHGLRRLAALEATRGSFAGAVEAIGRATGQPLGKRQVEELAGRTAADFDEFYAGRQQPQDGDPDDVLVISADGKGIVMRPDALRPATAEAAAQATTKLETRLSKGEKRNRKRMAEVGTVYNIAPAPRSPADILPAAEEGGEATAAPVARNKWLTASVVDDAASVVGQVFDEAERRDPQHRRTWVALVDGNNHQIHRIGAEAQARGVTVPIVCDFVHVLEYLWRAAWCFYDEGDPAAESWVHDKARSVLSGETGKVAAAIRRKATNHGLSTAQRANADRCADYLTNKKPYLGYPTALERGWPIATGVIEGACRHLVKDRMDITGARWGLD
ncbi:MAG: ISKra4 family transposase, partial [Acidimicrobiales bacterium]